MLRLVTTSNGEEQVLARIGALLRFKGEDLFVSNWK
jgi:hypothetical protein